MKKKLLLSAALLFSLFGFMVVFMTASVAAQVPTIPTRTPTPGPQTPTALPTTVVSTPPPGDSPPPPGAATATPAGEAGAAAATESAFYPTAVPCSNQPTILALNANLINVRSGPDTRYPVVGSLLFREVRPIIGRDASAPWWFIQLNDRQTGWVADAVVEVQGNTTAVPIVTAPPLDGTTVTPGIPWQPTTPPPCATPSTATPTATASPPPSPVSEAIVVVPLATAASDAYPAATAGPTTQTSVLSEAVTPTATATAIILPTSIAAVPQPTLPSTPIETSLDTTETDYSGLLLVGAALLLAAGTAVFLIKRR
ncbi:MAG: SH3 domain-containing protein [Chloroflexi bacterium]|nr:SH3 domain-containing protein [Ardenticatenaceae bacterium]MBL1128768.1 SH3 domain-containing protein [Chloroflexota bacterium]NOG34846.1 SH3 domain-containing protein [Chloroflexota bacterium]GIK57306.1 MAG: hypothetical protein BroJett015_29690 [Chloroflexota bacterium]